ncbi:2,4'-dihydroxyacetophenone dioxygenase family protein [Luteolibacter sp. AS25]|uniref:2,4'-dihydroxyacetophenone dioxygenase family protein n=1 Tax=Luteolibacter sp. AS25 TaxID=3135776 RepID=UPI00398B096C
MPISRFKSYTDLIPSDKRVFHDYTVDVTPEFMADEDNWIPYIPGVDFIPLWFGNRSQPGFSNILRVQPGSQLNPHYHPAGVYGFTIQGSWRYLEHDWVANTGSFLWEPPGEAHTLVVDADAKVPMMTYFVSLGGLVYLESMENPVPVGYDDGFTLLEIALEHYKNTGKDVDKLYALCR